MSDLTARDIHELDQAAVEAASDVDALADDPETTLRLADRGPAVYAAQLTADIADAAGERPMTLAAFAAWQTIRRVQERAELRAEVERLRAGNANLFRNALVLADEVVHASAARAASEGSEDARLAIAEQRVSLAQGLGERWAGNKDVLLASAGRELLRATGGA